MKSEDIEFNVGDIVYSAKGQNRLTGDYAILKQRVEAVALEVDADGLITNVSYVLTDDLGKERSTKARVVFTTIEDAIEYVKND